jgi:hypothetical protein
LTSLAELCFYWQLPNGLKRNFWINSKKFLLPVIWVKQSALYQSLPIMPYPKELTQRAAEGVRSNITSVFDAVAHHNPYPADYMDDDAFNQIVLKALFVGSPLYKIQGLDRRANRKLAKMLIEYAHERWSAGRVISPELWRPVGPFIDEKHN